MLSDNDDRPPEKDVEGQETDLAKPVEKKSEKKMGDEKAGRSFKTIKRVYLGGIDTGCLTRSELAEILVDDCLDRRGRRLSPRLVFSSNGQGIALAGSDLRFADALDHADLVHADGMSVVMASKFVAEQPLPERVPTTDFFHDAAKAGQSRRLRFFMLGGREEINKKAFDLVRQKYPDIEWVGRHHGFFSIDDEKKICADIVAAKTDVLWLALGRPHQEYFAIRNRDNLAGVGWIKTCGGLFDFIAGVNKRAPRWMQRICMEWFWRMMQEPRRLMWRYTKTNLQAIWRLATCSGSRKGRLRTHTHAPFQH